VEHFSKLIENAAGANRNLGVSVEDQTRKLIENAAGANRNKHQVF
jgi:hypothetical protein